MNKIISGRELLQDVTIEEIMEAVDENPSLRGFLQGYIAEIKLKKQLMSLEGIESVQKIPDRSPLKGDFMVEVGDKSVTIEVKSVSSHNAKEDFLNGGKTGKISLKRTDSTKLDNGETTYCLPKGEFDILAACMFPVTGKWEFQFINTKYLQESEKSPGRLSTTVHVSTHNTPMMKPDVFEVFAEF